jgi:hypothetical protein
VEGDQAETVSRAAETIAEAVRKAAAL